ncbi:MAG: hydroxyacylglutathione hydrolase C-terminal domain-containing protein [Thermodesulfobacteriota bacterium]
MTVKKCNITIMVTNNMDIFEESGFGIARIRIKESDNNYNYIIWCRETLESAVIDPLNAYTILDFIRGRDLTVRYIINTHAHPDHIEGNNAILKVTTAKILIHPKGTEFVAPRHETIEENSVIDIGKQQINVMYTPGHCPEHVSLILGNNIFVGDTLFLSGCGTIKFRGNINELYETVAFRLRTLPDNFRIFCGHNYAEKNLLFALDIEPENKAAKAKLEEVRNFFDKGKEPSPTTIGEEKQYNPFLRFDEPSLVSGLKKRNPSVAESPEAIFRTLRAMRNNW